GDTVNVAREQRHLPYVPGTGEPREEPPKPQRVPTMWRHAVSHRVEVPRIRREVRHATRSEHRGVVRVPMQPLRADHNLEPAEDEVESARLARATRVGMRVERARLGRIPVDEHKVRAVLAQRPLTDEPL